VVLLPMLAAANEVSARIDPASVDQQDFSKWEVALIVPGVLLCALALLGAALPDVP
jgi:hypothetical protein